MQISKGALAGAACAALLGLAACGQGGQQSAPPAAVRVDGSSTVFPLSEAAAEAFIGASNGRARVTVGESGTGGGFRKFCAGETEVQGASRPILETEIAACAAAGIRYVEAGVAMDGLTVVVHPTNPLNSITVAELRRMWEPAAEGRITNWRQINPRFPDLGLQLFGAGTASGTFDFFTEAVVGEAKSSRTDYTPTEDDNVTVQGVAGNPGAVGYFGLAYYEQNRERLKALAIDNGSGPVAPTPQTVAGGQYLPLSRPMFVYFNADALQRPQVQEFAQYYMANAGRLAQQVGYIALPEEVYTAYAARLRSRETGTAFGGHQEIGVDMTQVLTRPLTEGEAAAAPAAP